ncbi:hypothetical protein TRVL_09912 [Trypanosoma vivax]|nr:hypothetical protein TRVL_09912 [Trypanosoma vivax]
MPSHWRLSFCPARHGNRAPGGMTDRELLQLAIAERKRAAHRRQWNALRSCRLCLRKLAARQRKVPFSYGAKALKQAGCLHVRAKTFRVSCCGEAKRQWHGRARKATAGTHTRLAASGHKLCTA